MAFTTSKVGIAPGTTTLTIGRGGSISGFGEPLYFDARPTDFDFVPSRGYLPVKRGWLVGKLSGAELGGCGCARRLGEEIATESDGKGLDPTQEEEISKRILAQLAIEEKAHHLKEARSRRFWGSIIGLAAGTSAVISVLNYMKKS